MNLWLLFNTMMNLALRFVTSGHKYPSSGHQGQCCVISPPWFKLLRCQSCTSRVYVVSGVLHCCCPALCYTMDLWWLPNNTQGKKLLKVVIPSGMATLNLILEFLLFFWSNSMVLMLQFNFCCSCGAYFASTRFICLERQIFLRFLNINFHTQSFILFSVIPTAIPCPFFN